MTRYNPYPQVFVARYGALILKENGDLYALGHNMNQRFGDNVPQTIPGNQPILIQTNIIHAALSEFTMMTVNSDHEVQMTGDNEYVRRFKGFSNAKKVYSSPVGHVYLIETMNNQFYGFGKNAPDFPDFSDWMGVFRKPEIKTLHTFEDITVTETIDPSKYDSMERKHLDRFYEVRDKILCTPEYDEAVKKYGINNLKFYLEDKEDLLVSKQYRTPGLEIDAIQFHHVTYSPVLKHCDIELYEPVLYQGEQYRPSKCFFGCMFAPDLESSIVHAGIVRKAILNQNVTVVLHQDFSLTLWKSKAFNYIPFMENVADISATTDTILIAEHDGTFWIGFDDNASLYKKKLLTGSAVNNLTPFTLK